MDEEYPGKTSDVKNLNNQPKMSCKILLCNCTTQKNKISYRHWTAGINLKSELIWNGFATNIQNEQDRFYLHNK